jgi:D-alanine-D-alanine ligase
MHPKKAAVLFGGRSGEHVVSLRSAASIMEAINRERYQVIPVGIARDGRWLAGKNIWQILWEQRPLEEAARAVLLTDPRNPGLIIENKGVSSTWEFQPLDVVFPVLHGPYGEDGTVQGLLELAGIPYVGSGVLASAVAMDKVIMKTLFEKNGIPVGDYIYFSRSDWGKQEPYWREETGRRLGYPCFVKPANLGSSVGITRVTDDAGLPEAVREALRYDDKVLIEAFIKGREIECSVLGDLEPRASRPGEIIPCNEFYDYRAKYIDDRSELVVPVELGSDLEEKVRELACRAFTAVEASGLARVDFFVDTDRGEIIVNEINTIPGFTSISMYPKLWEASGIGYRELVSRLMDLAVKRFQRRQGLLTAPPE